MINSARKPIDIICAEQQCCHRIDQQGAFVQGLIAARRPEVDQPGEAQITHAQKPGQETEQADRAEEMLRPPPKSGKELDGEQVEESLDDAAEAELGLAKSPRPVLNDQFADTKATSSGQHRDEAVQLAVQTNLAEYLGPITLHAAVVVVEADSRQPAYQPVEHAAGPNLVPGVVPNLLPTTDHIEVFAKSGQKTRHLFGVVLEIGVQGENDIARAA